MGVEDGLTLNVQKPSPEAPSSRMSGTARDKQDMWRVGRDQELNVGLLDHQN